MVKFVYRQETFIRSVIKYLSEHHLDGVNIDWEYPGQRAGASRKDKRRFAGKGRIKIYGVPGAGTIDRGAKTFFKLIFPKTQPRYPVNFDRSLRQDFKSLCVFFVKLNCVSC